MFASSLSVYAQAKEVTCPADRKEGNVQGQTEWAEFRVDTLTDTVFKRMKGRSFPDGCTVKRSDLRYLQVMHYDAEGQVKRGEMVCNKAIADDLLDIFKKLYTAPYPIERMQLIDDYDASDEQSMRANNTSCFCYRVVEGSTKLSKHAQGLAVDINPLYNPCVRTRRDGSLLVQPATGVPYLNRSRAFDYKITTTDLLFRLFTEHGFTWGGSWRTVKDYQHFEKALP